MPQPLIPCPVCGRQPEVAPCEPWPTGEGPRPWYAGCYQASGPEHFVGGTGATKHEALAEWQRVAAERSKQVKPR